VYLRNKDYVLIIHNFFVEKVSKVRAATQHCAPLTFYAFVFNVHYGDM
jgi:hypothetical protein